VTGPHFYFIKRDKLCLARRLPRKLGCVTQPQLSQAKVVLCRQVALSCACASARQARGFQRRGPLIKLPTPGNPAKLIISRGL